MSVDNVTHGEQARADLVRALREALNIIETGGEPAAMVLFYRPIADEGMNVHFAGDKREIAKALAQGAKALGIELRKIGSAA